MEWNCDPLGSALLKISGILMILFGVLGILVYLAGLAAVFGLSYITAGLFSSSQDLVGVGLLLASALMELIAGILGARSAKRPDRTRRCLIPGSLTLLITAAGLLHILLRSRELPWLSLILGLILPVVYLIGTVLLRNSPLAAEDAEEA